MKKAFLLIFVILSLTSIASAQDNNDNTILLFSGGKIDFQTAFYWQLLTGSGQSFGYKSGGSWDVWQNPAALLAFKQPYISVSLQPGLMIDPAKYYDINGTVRDEINDATEDYRTQGSSFDYPSVGGNVGQKSGINGFQIAYPVQSGNHHSVASFEISQPFYLVLNSRNNGLSTLIETKKQISDQDKIIHIRINALFQANLDVRATRYQLGFSQKMGESFGLGVRVGQTQIHSFLNGAAKINGIMETAGTEYAFNDPYDPRIDFETGETNKLDQSLFFDFRGNNWNFQIGGLVRISNSFVIGLDIDRHSTATLSGDMSVEQYKIPALNTEALTSDDPDVELVEPTKLNLAKLTLTEPIDNPISDQLSLYFPSSFGMQVSYQGSFLESTLSLRNYSGRFGYNFLNEKRYADLGYSLQVDLSLSWFNLSAGAIHAELVEEKYNEVEKSSSLWIPNGSLGIAFFLFDKYHLSSSLFFAPTPGLGVKAGYFF